MSGVSRGSRGRAWWLDAIAARTSQRLRELQRLKLWNGRPAVPVEHVIEHILGLSISYEEIEEHPDEEILGSFRPSEREIVLNARHSETFATIPGRLRFTLAHEAGHADLYALADATAQGELGAVLTGAYHPRHKSATRGTVAVTSLRLSEQLRRLPPEQRNEFYRRLHDAESERAAKGHDTPLVRRTVDTYAAMLLMPADVVHTRAKLYDVTDHAQLRNLAQEFEVSTTAMRYRVVDLSLAYEGPTGALQLTDPAHKDQCTLF
jgi:hypothetical protein